MLVEDLRDVLHGRKVQRQPLADVGALHLDGNVAPVPQRGAVHLSQRCGGERFRVERREVLRDAQPQLLADDALDAGVGERIDRILEARQRLEVRRRQQVGARRQQLPELDVGGTEPLEISGELLRGRRAGRGAGVFGAERLFEAGAIHQIGAPVLEQQPGNVFIAFQSFGM